ncbi:dihydrodipicolinate synthase family protein [Coralliovum pocilloporae]|uniref:dihydrodipicolinate synthase family protein n=1 Tax=Coralliovum pocilloporae TaxID=3066369 RepID=UPI0033078477
MSMAHLRGVIAPNLTPFNDDLTIAEDLYLAHARALLDNGCSALAPFGTTGEALSVGVGERLEILKLLVDAGVDPMRLVPGTGLTSLPDTANLSRACFELGCAAVMVLPPFFFKDVPEQGLYDYFAQLLEMIDHPGQKIWLYHIPQVASVGIPVDVVRRLHEDFPEQIVGIKDSSGDWSNTEALLSIDGLTVYPGAEVPLIDALEMGGQGCITATANLNAAKIAEVIRTFDTGDVAQAHALHEGVRAFRLAVQNYALIPGIKRLMALWSGDERWANVRPPLLPASSASVMPLLDQLKAEFDYPPS